MAFKFQLKLSLQRKEQISILHSENISEKHYLKILFNFNNWIMDRQPY